MNIEINEKFIKITKENIIVRMDFATKIDESKIDWYISDLKEQLENELKLRNSSFSQILNNKLSYQIQRKNEYPAIEQQLDMLYWDLINGTNNWLDNITEIKRKYPKPDLK